MPITPLEVLDTAIKIGFGCAIAAVTAFVTLKVTVRNDRAKEMRAHKIKSLEMISVHSEAYFNVYLAFQSRCLGFREDVKDDVQYPFTAEDPCMQRLNELDDPFTNAIEGLYAAIARLHLLGAAEAVKSLDEIRICVVDFRNTLFCSRVIPTLNELNSTYDRFRELRKEFHRNLAEVYAHA